MGRENGRIIAFRSVVTIAFVLALVLGWVPKANAAPTLASIIGEIERITLNDPNDAWSGGTIVVGGQVVIIPRNLLIDLPANRLTLKQIIDQAPAACITNGESGLAKADVCNTSGLGAFATMSANRSDAGNVIAGDVLIDKGLESVTGFVTFINHAEGYYRLGGQSGVDNAGVIVRLNDPGARHTVQSGLGCAAGNTANCSPDPRFTLDPDNYTNVFSNGYPYCLPSTVSRTFTNILGDNVTSSVAAADGTGDYLCPDANRPAGLNLPAADSRRLAPLKVGDTITAEGNFETIDGVRFLSAHSSTIGIALPSATTAGQPDYFFLAEVFMDAPAFFNQRYRALIIGYTTLADPAVGGTDVLFWTIHRDKVNNAIHELPWATVQGCDAAGGAGTCSSQGLVGAGGNIFRIRHDIDFLLAADGAQRFGGSDPRLSPCAHLRGESRFGNPTPFCPSATSNPNGNDGTGSLAEEFGIFSPIPHEIMSRTGRKVADVGNTIKTIDVSGNEATWGEYLFPFGVNLGGISLQEMNEIDLNLMATPNLFEGIPWNLDRRLGPGGCPGDPAVCEADVPGNPYAYALDPFPYSGFHPKTALVTLGIAPPGGLPTGTYTDQNFTASTLTDVQNRMFSFVGSAPGAIFNGDSTVIANASFASLIPPAIPIVETPPLPTPPPLPANAVTLTALPAGSAPSGDNVAFTGLASGGTAPYEYQFMAAVAGSNFVVAQPYTTTDTWSWNTTGSPAGAYIVQVYARSVGSLAALEALGTVNYTLTVGGTAPTSVTLAAAPADNTATGGSVAYTATVNDGTGPFEYEFRARVTPAGSFVLAQPYTATNSWSWNTTGSPAGSYEVQVNVRRAGQAATEATTTIPYVLTVTGTAPTSVTLAAVPADNTATGGSVTYTATVNDGTGPFEYEFQARVAPGGSFVLAQSYTATNSWSWNTTGSPAGDYEVQVNVRRAGQPATETSATIPYVLTP